MLNKVNRINKNAEFRETMRKGRKITTTNFVIYLRTTNTTTPRRFGFIVSTKAGNAVTRKNITRHLREITRTLINDNPTGTDIVIRALKGSENLTWDELNNEILNRIS